LGYSAEHLVIVVDDDPKIRESLENLLKAAGFTAAVFPSAEETLQSGSLAQASCLITDVRMPGIQGLELQRLVKRDYPALPVIVITGHRDDHVRQNALSAGAASFLYKPFDPKTLLHAIHTGISSSAQGA
jgi:FixJ family two-component response regulator